jgi:hypothetical protein
LTNVFLFIEAGAVGDGLIEEFFLLKRIFKGLF